VLGDPFILSNRTQIAELAVRNRFPAIYYSTEFVEHGGLMSYGALLICTDAPLRMWTRF
jgi:hypothetical protein